MRRALPFVLMLFVGCVGTAGEGVDADGSGGQGQDGSGGATQAGSGGKDAGSGGATQTGSGGKDAGSGGIVGAGSGGMIGSGGMVGSGGRVGSGGIVASGGRVGSGGVVGSGGAATGGNIGSGGIVGSGGGAGRAGSGGMMAGGGRGGRVGTGGMVAGSGGIVGTGGMVIGSGGTSAPVCTSGKTWSSGNGQDMRPGLDCKSCHSFTIAGTVYPTAHEPNNCDGTAAGGIKVVVTGADGSTITLTPSATSGSFYSNSALKTPFTAKVTNAAGTVRMMVASQTAGNCNSCHTQTGANGAPGRIMAP